MMPTRSCQRDCSGRVAVRWVLLALAVFLSVQLFAQPKLSGKVSGGFQAPSSTDAEGRRHVLRGEDMESRGKDLLELTRPRVTRYNPDDTPDMFIESARCFYHTRMGVANSPTNLLVRTADSRFSIEGVGWHWDLSASVLTISNQVAATVQKAALADPSFNLTNPPASRTNEPIRIRSNRFQQEGDAASFLGDVVVRDGADTLRCQRLNIVFVKPGGAQRIEAIDEVDIAQADTRIRSGRAVYDVKDNIIRISERPEWFASRREGSADLLVLNRPNDALSASGHVYMKLPVTNLVMAVESEMTNQTERFVEIRSDQFEFQNARSNLNASAVYTGEVEARQGQAVIRCEQLNADFGASNRLSRLHAQRNVRIESSGNRVFGNDAEYDFNNEKVVMRGEPRWEMNETRGRSEVLVFLPKTKEILALTNVEMVVPGPSTGTVFGLSTNAQGASTAASPLRITSDRLSHSENVSIFEKEVRVSDARGTIECQVLTFVSGQSNQVSRIVAEGAVVVRQPDLVALGDRAEYDRATGLVKLTGRPELLAPDKTLRAEYFVIDRNRNTFAVSPGNYRIEMKLNEKQKAPLSSNP